MMRRTGAFITGVVGIAFLPACIPASALKDFYPAANQPPKVSTGGDKVVAGGGNVELDGSATTDPDGDTLTFQWSQVSGPSVTLSNADASRASFQAPEVTSDTALMFELVVTDSRGGRSTGSVRVTVRPKSVLNARAGNDQQVPPNWNVTLHGYNFGAPGDYTYGWRQTAGPNIVLSHADTPSPNFIAPAADANQTVTLEFLIVGDGYAPSSDSVNVTIVPPVAQAPNDYTTAPNYPSLLQGVVSGIDPMVVQWVQTAGPNATISDANSLVTSFVAPVVAENTTLTFELRVTDPGGNIAADTVNVVVYPPKAGAATGYVVPPNSEVFLHGYPDGVTVTGQPLAVHWRQTAGQGVEIGNADSADANFIVPAVNVPTALTFEFSVTDIAGNTARQPVDVNVIPPHAQAPDDFSVAAGANVVLEGTASGADPNRLMVLWGQTAGQTVTLLGSQTRTASFTAPNVVEKATLAFGFVVMDDQGNPASDTVNVRVVPIGMADAGATVYRTAGDNVVLHGLYPGDDGTAAYHWRQTAGPNAPLSDPNVREPNFIAPNVDADTVLAFELTVTVPTGGTSTDSVGIGVSPVPQADAGADQTVGPNEPVVLQGANKAQGTVAFAWRQTNGPTVQMSDPNSASATFTSPIVVEETTLTFELALKNPGGRTSTDTVNINVIPTKADAGPDQTVAPNQPVTLHGSAGGIGDLTVGWRQTAGPTVTLTNAGSAEPNFIAPQVDANTVLTFEMTIADAQNKTDTATTNVTVVPVTADAGRDYITEPNVYAFLDGSASGVSPLTAVWRQVKEPNEPNVFIPDANGPASNFYLDNIPGGTTLHFELEVTDGAGNVATSTMNVNVRTGIHVRFKTTMGDFVMAMYSENAPLSVSNFLRYVNHSKADPNRSFYEGLTLHRVIPVNADPNLYSGMGIVQGGGWDPNLNSPPRYDPIPLESNNGLSNIRGAVAMARLSQPDTATSEFYVDLKDNLDLDYNNPAGNLGYAVFANIIQGMDVIDAMSHVQTTSRPAPWNPQLIFYDIPVVPIIIEQVLIE